MKTVVSAVAAVLALGLCAAAQAAEPVKVMIVGTFHMSNPDQDLHNMKVEDVLQPKPQAQIASIIKGIGRFKPTLVATEWPKNLVDERWPRYVAGTLPPSRNEVVQLGFGLAKATGAKVVGVDVDGDFPYGPVEAYAKAHGGTEVLDAANAEVGTMVKDQERRLASEGIVGTLRHMNDPRLIANGNGFYRSTLRIGGGETQPGADLMTGWYRRNFLICANIIQLSKPGDRIVVFYGAGHSFLLRQCVQETPGFELVEPNAYLPG